MACLTETPTTHLPNVEDHPHYGLSIEIAPHHFVAARSNGSGQGWRVEVSHRGLTIHRRSTTRELAYRLVFELAGLTETAEQVAA